MTTDPLIQEARATAQGLKDTAAHCHPDQEALRARLLIAASVIGRLIHRIQRGSTST